MPRFHFHLRARGAIHRDQDGTECADLVAARSHAVAVASELMRHSGQKTRHWSMLVVDALDESLFDLFFADIDPVVGDLPPELRELTAHTCRRHGALIDVLAAVRATRVESRRLLARARQKPQLAYAKGRLP